jgi:hypothetical protein
MIYLSALETTNTKLAACLAACGIPLRKDTPIKKLTGDRGDQICFFFEEFSPCGQYETSKLIAVWEDREWHLKNPEHPFAYLKVAFDNFERLTDYARRGVPTVACAYGSKIAFLSLNASDELQRKVFAKLHER